MKKKILLYVIIALCCVGCTTQAKNESNSFSSYRTETTEILHSNVTTDTTEKGPIKVYNAETNQTKNQRQKVKKKTTPKVISKKEADSKLEWYKTWNRTPIILVIIVIFIFIFYLCASVHSLKKRISENEKQCNQIKLDIAPLLKIYGNNRQSLHVQEVHYTTVADKNKKKATDDINNVTPPQPAKEEKPTVKTHKYDEEKEILIYLKNFDKGSFKECNIDCAQYVLRLQKEGDTVGSFAFIGDPKTALATKDATFEGVCDCENWTTNSKKCYAIGDGLAEKQEGKWRVIKKAKVKCE